MSRSVLTFRLVIFQEDIVLTWTKITLTIPRFFMKTVLFIVGALAKADTKVLNAFFV